MDEALSPSSFSPSVEGQEDVDQRPPASTSGRGENPVALPKAKVEVGRSDTGVLETRDSLGQRDAHVAQRLDEELKRSATEASMVRSKIREEDLENIRLSYDIPTSVMLWAPSPEE
ncbi:hypothetical protein Adt_26579 [Abeliophyllum distichum]|uniref:Uncharacterized protein n=1 Tax=Abeliophyllum distichum TaxID=126358 RepID=A0ABD1RRZ9_9LAMI